ncbi:MAG TPA: DUF3179 domain-containing protein [Candidatus Dormibacteraeota bacterium]|nr:DUF3179 domain-containing protein [Candidatus Dormibacteraeota bacterium]
MNAKAAVGAAGAVLLLVSACGGGSGAPAGGAAKQPSAAPEVERFSRDGWKTNFDKHSVPLSEISSGGPRKDGIPPLDHPKFVGAAEAGTWLQPAEPVIALSVGAESRAYPMQILIWHEIVNDTVGGVPVTVTFCPLCYTAIAFDRHAASRILDFGTTGNLRKSDLVMYDRQTESWWQQAVGRAIVGDLTGTQLTILPASIVSWAIFRTAHPEGTVLSKDTGFNRSYGVNPYSGYDSANSQPFLFEGKLDGRLPPKEHVVTVSLAGEDVAYPYSLLKQRRVVHDGVGGRPVVVFYQAGTRSAMDAGNVADGFDLGASGVFSPELEGRRLTFKAAGSDFVDAETGSSWNLLGKAVAGPLAGRQLQPIAHGDDFWFEWAAFKPATRIYR